MKKIAHQRYVDAHGNVEKHPAPDEIGCRFSRHNHEFAQQYQPYQADILVPDAGIHYCLRQKGEYQLQHTPQ